MRQGVRQPRLVSQLERIHLETRQNWLRFFVVNRVIGGKDGDRPLGTPGNHASEPWKGR